MKSLFISLAICLIGLSASAQTKENLPTAPDASKPVQEVEAACGQCKFKMPGKGCTLAVRVNGKAYFVDGTDIDSHGDAHANDGFCQAVRKAKVQGEVVNNRFAATYFALLPEPEKKPKN